MIQFLKNDLLKKIPLYSIFGVKKITWIKDAVFTSTFYSFQMYFRKKETKKDKMFLKI